MSGKRITKSERRLISKGRRYAQRIRDTYPEDLGYAAKTEREFRLIGK